MKVYQNVLLTVVFVSGVINRKVINEPVYADKPEHKRSGKVVFYQGNEKLASFYHRCMWPSCLQRSNSNGTIQDSVCLFV